MNIYAVINISILIPCITPSSSPSQSVPRIALSPFNLSFANYFNPFFNFDPIN
jgi:hypothetical protein